jgi:hypothetical protein
MYIITQVQAKCNSFGKSFFDTPIHTAGKGGEFHEFVSRVFIINVKLNKKSLQTKTNLTNFSKNNKKIPNHLDYKKEK